MALGTELTSFTRDVLGRYHCSLWDEATKDSADIDVVVLGAGMYGGYCASKIYELSKARFGRPLRVLVLEAGPHVLPEHGQNNPNLGFYNPSGTQPITSGANVETRNEVWGIGWRSNQQYIGQAYCVGGKGLFWGGWCPRLQATDLAQWPSEVSDFLTQVHPSRPVSTRPITHNDLATGNKLKRGDPLSGYEAVEYEIGVLPVDDFVFDPVQTAAESIRRIGLNEALRLFMTDLEASIDSRITQVLPAPIAVQTQSFIAGLFSLDKYSSVPAMFAAARDDHGDGRDTDLRMAIVPNCHVRLLTFRPDPEAAQRGTRTVEKILVQVGNEAKELVISPHCQVVLAMSAIESTRLALESFSLVGSGLRAPGDELMGRNFMIHLRFDISFAVDRAKFAKWVEDHRANTQLADELQLASLHIQCEGASGRYQYQLYAATNADGPDANLYKLIPDLDIQTQIASSFDQNRIKVVLRASGEVIGGRNAPLGDPNFDYIDLAGDADTDNDFGHRRAWVQFNRDHQQAAIWQEMHDTAHAIARALGNGDPPDYLGGNYTLPAVRTAQGVGTTYHDSGTLWMGDSPNSSVTDVNGHFHHVSNVYCSDQALFTTVGSANPVLTGLGLTRKVAQDIVDRHSELPTERQFSGLTGVSLGESTGWLQSPYRGMLELNTAGGTIIETRPTAGIGLYYLPKLLTNFELSIEWKAFRTAEMGGPFLMANSGLLLRTGDPRSINFANPSQFQNFYDECIEIQIDEQAKRYDPTTGQSVFGDSHYKTGAVYGQAPATQWAAKVAAPDRALDQFYWNRMEVSLSGRRCRVWLNSKSVCDANIPNSKRSSGFIGLQFHTGRVQFRNLQLRDI